MARPPRIYPRAMVAIFPFFPDSVLLQPCSLFPHFILLPLSLSVSLSLDENVDPVTTRNLSTCACVIVLVKGTDALILLTNRDRAKYSARTRRASRES